MYIHVRVVLVLHHNSNIYPLYQTLSHVQTGDPVQLQQPIDNCDGNLCVGLKYINYTVGWYDIDLPENALILWNTDPQSTLPFSSQYIINDRPGVWSYTALADKMNAYSDKCSILLNRTTGKITLTVNPTYTIFSAKLASMY